MGLITALLAFSGAMYNFVDGLGSWAQYRKQKVVQQMNGRIISIHWAYKWFNKNLPKGKVKFIEQSKTEHSIRFARVGWGFVWLSFAFFALTPAGLVTFP